MLGLATVTAAVDRDFTTLIDELDRLDGGDWYLPTRCAGWEILDLAVHVAGASRGQAEGLRRAIVGDPTVALLDPPAERDPAAVLAALRRGRDELLDALRALTGEHLSGAVPLPFGLLPTPVALQIIALEYGFHRNDLSWALRHELPLGPDIAATLIGVLPGLLPMLAAGSPVSAPGSAPDGPTSYRLVAESAAWQADFTEAGWTVAPGAGADAECTVAGDDSAVALFAMGRIDAEHPSLAVTAADRAALFKTYFPGP